MTAKRALSPKINVWDRQPGERSRHWGAFLKYRDMPASERSYGQVAKDFGKTLRWAEQLGSAWHWVSRTAAYDIHRDQQLQASTIVDMEKIRRQQLQIGQLFTTTGALVVKKILKQESESETTTLSPRDAAALVEVGTKLLNLYTGQPTERTETTFVGIVGAAEMSEAMKDGAYRAKLKDVVNALDALESKPSVDSGTLEQGPLEESPPPKADK